MLAIGVAWWGWPDWSEAKRRRVARRLVIRTVREVLPSLMTPYGRAVRRRDIAIAEAACRRSRTTTQARKAAEDAAVCLSGYGSFAAQDAASAARWAALDADSSVGMSARVAVWAVCHSRREEARPEMLDAMVDIFVEAARA
jgi:uncharacterized membrane protein YccC